MCLVGRDLGSRGLTDRTRAFLKDRGDLLIGRKSPRAHVCQTSVDASALVLAQLVGASAASANLARMLRKFLLILKRPRLHFVEQLFCQCRHNMNFSS